MWRLARFIGRHPVASLITGGLLAVWWFLGAFAPWVGRDGKIRRAFRADGVEPVPASKQAAHAA